VIAGKDNDPDTSCARLLRWLQTGEFDRELFEPAERAGRLGQLRLARHRRLAMRARYAGAFFVDPLGEHVVCLRSREPLSRHDLRLRT
jgi:hypothetical protein